MISNDRKIELFFGTGGVGKTTLAASRAFYLSSLGHKTLIITIDPSLRLKQLLGLEEVENGEVSQVKETGGNLHALMLCPSKTLSRSLKNQSSEDVSKNPIFSSLSRQHGGLNEIMAVIELQHQIEKGDFDRIVVDTPPGRHFIDFLKATSKINSFFDKNFVDIFKYLDKPIEKAEKFSKVIMNKIVTSGIKKLLSYLENVTGAHFVNLFIDTVLILYQNRDHFLDSLKFQEVLKDNSTTNLFLVTAVDHNKILEAKEMGKKVDGLSNQNQILLINRSLESYLKEWEINESNKSLAGIKASFKRREAPILEFASKNFTNYLCFPEIIGGTLNEQITTLQSTWAKDDN